MADQASEKHALELRRAELKEAYRPGTVVPLYVHFADLFGKWDGFARTATGHISQESFLILEALYLGEAECISSGRAERDIQMQSVCRALDEGRPASELQVLLNDVTEHFYSVRESRYKEAWSSIAAEDRALIAEHVFNDADQRLYILDKNARKVSELLAEEFPDRALEIITQRCKRYDREGEQQ